MLKFLCRFQDRHVVSLPLGDRVVRLARRVKRDLRAVLACNDHSASRRPASTSPRSERRGEFRDVVPAGPARGASTASA